MSLPDQLPLGPRHQLSPGRREEVDLLRRLQQMRVDPTLVTVRQLLAVRLAMCQVRLVKASLNDVALLQGEARTLEKLLSDLSGERPPIE
jgi:hypothetical protein